MRPAVHRKRLICSQINQLYVHSSRYGCSFEEKRKEKKKEHQIDLLPVKFSNWKWGFRMLPLRNPNSLSLMQKQNWYWILISAVWDKNHVSMNSAVANSQTSGVTRCRWAGMLSSPLCWGGYLILSNWKLNCENPIRSYLFIHNAIIDGRQVTRITLTNNSVYTVLGTGYVGFGAN